MEKELEKLFSCTNLKQSGPYELKATIILLSETYKCQFFIFDGINNSSKLYYMYPEAYNDTMKPIFLYRPQFDSNHVIFIRHLNAFFKANSFVCFACFRVFKRNRESRSSHLCKKRLTCFVCRRFFQTSETYLNPIITSNFCDKLITNETSFLCSKCNCQIYSQKCLLGHKRFCKGAGYFGYKCLDCKKFTYCRNNTSSDVKAAHICSEGRTCRNCFLIKENWHQCPMKLEKPHDFHTRLSFFKIIFDNIDQPLFAIFYREEKERGNFAKHIFFDNELGHDIFEDNCLSEQYFKPNWDIDIAFKLCNKLSDKSTFFQQLQSLKTKDTCNLSDKVLFFLLDENFCHTTYICEDSSSTNLMLILNWFVNQGICPRLIRKGRNIIIIEVPELHIRFIASNNYVSGNEYELAKQFNISFVPEFFPELIISKENFGYEGKIPKVDNFYHFNYSESQKKQVTLYVSSLKTSRWNFKRQILIHYDQKIQLLLLSMLRFLSQSFHFQYELNANCKKILNPFNNPICSIGSYVFALFKIFYLNNYNVFAVPHEYGRNHKYVSHIEYKYCCFMDHIYPDKKFQFAFNNPDGPKYFVECIPDLFSPVTKEAIFFNGCFFHAHYDNCLINKKANENSKHPFGATYKEINLNFFSKLELLMKNHPEISKVTVEWECNFLKKLKSGEGKMFIDHNFIPHCLNRLKPRDTVRGAFSDVYALKWQKKENEVFYCLDINGLYSYCAIKFPYMTGQFKVLIGNSLRDLQILNEKFYYKAESVMGSILLKILPPTNLFAPYLLYRKLDGTTVNTLCKKCAELNIQKCNHSNEERSFIATYMISEIEFALHLNYKVLQIYEAHIYLTKDFLLKDFIQKLNYYKTISSDCFQKCGTEREKNQYCTYLNEKMDLEDPNFQIKIGNVKPNCAQRNYFKLLCNSLFGKFIQRSDKSEIRFIKSQEELNKIYFSGEQIDDFVCPNEHICMLFLKKNIFKLPPNRKQNVYIGSQITAYARQIIYQHIEKVSNMTNFKVFQVECDSIYFTGPINEPCPLFISHALGDFKIEYSDKILSYYALGPKHYCVNYIDNSNIIQNVCKFSGLSLKNELNQTIINHNTFEFFLNEFIKHKHQLQELHQKIIKADFKTLTVSSHSQKFSVQNKVSKRRCVKCDDEYLTTFPFGFSDK